MDESFNDELRRRLRRYAEEPSDILWHSILARKDAEDRVFTIRERKKIGLMIIAGLLLMSGFEFLHNAGTKSNEPIVNSQSLQSSVAVIQQHHQEAPATTLQSMPQVLVAQKLPTNEIRHVARNRRINELQNQVSIIDEQAAISRESEMIPLATEDRNDLNESLPETDLLADNMESQRTAVTKKDSISTEKEIANKVAVVQKKTALKEQKEKRKWPSLYFIVMPTFGYNSIKSNSNDNIIIESIERIPTFSLDRLGVRAELGAEDPITNRIKVFGGLVYYQRKQTIGYTEKQFEQAQISQGPDGGIVIEPKFTHVQKSFDYELRNLGLQVGVNYQLSKKKFLQTAGTGIEFHVALNKLKHSDQTPEFTSNPSAYVFYNLYYRLQYPAEGRFKGVLQPTLNYSLYLDQNLNAPFYVKPYGLGLNIGFTYNF